MKWLTQIEKNKSKEFYSASYAFNILLLQRCFDAYFPKTLDEEFKVHSSDEDPSAMPIVCKSSAEDFVKL